MIIYLVGKSKFDWITQCGLCGSKAMNPDNYYTWVCWRNCGNHWEWTGQMNENAGNETQTTISIPKEVTELHFCNKCYHDMTVPAHLEILSRITGWRLK